jgi:tRNA threonylcarbamoyladenosine biosynthesis protein TsaB
MNILAFDTCLNACSVAVGIGVGTKGARLVGRREAMDQGHAERLIPMIEDVLRDADILLTDVNHIVVSVGPGSFTGTRIGVAAARALRLARSVPVTAVSSLATIAHQAALLARNLLPPTTDECIPRAFDQICVVVDVRREEFYAQVFEADGMTPRTQPMLLNSVQISEMCQQASTLIVGTGIEPTVLGNGLSRAQTMLICNIVPDSRDMIAFVSHSGGYGHDLAPLYLRPPDAKPPQSPGIPRRVDGR